MSDRNDSRGLLDKRLLQYAVRIIHVVQAMPKNIVGRHIGKQMLRSGTSPEANYREACGAESRADFIHKMQVVTKELRETDYWLCVTRETKLIPAMRLEGIIQETNELTAMSVKSVVTAKSRLKNGKDQ